jgi:hypothetical protein
MLGLGLVFLREHIDDSIKHVDELEAQFGVPLMGIIPKVKKSKRAGARAGPAGGGRPAGFICRGLPLHAHRAAVLHL